MNTNQASQQTSRYLSAAVSAVLSLAAASAAHAGPQNGIVTSGNATISTPDLNLTQIDQGSHNASINWQSFDVAAQERVIFNQPSASSVALNRILTQDPSQIHGSITANGRVFLINPNGIIFGASSRINVGSLVASSLDIADVDAVTGRYTFNTAAIRSGAISNSGQITAADGGSVTLLGGSVVNNGLIVADYGSVNLGAGRAATLHFDGDGLVRFQIDAGLLPDSSGATAAVDNNGEIRADGGQVLLTARAASDVIARAVNNEGVIRAARIENVGGSIRLVGPEGAVVNSGTLDATGVGVTSTGGQVQVLGDRVELSGTALIDVSGSAGGGTALIGGSFAGADPAVLNAQQTDVQAGAAIRANAISSGDAGQVAVWADGTTTFHGDIFARAAGSDGNGGYAEVSGREHLRIGGHAWLESVNGAAGTLLLDPGAITIRNGANNAPTGTLDTINDGWVIGQLAGSNVIIETNSSNANNVENLTVEGPADIIWANTNSLTLRGDASVSLEAGSSIQNTGSGALILESADAVSIGGTVTLAGDLTVTAGANITQAAALSIGGASSFTTGVGQSVVLNNTGNSFAGAVSFAAGGPGNLLNVTVNDSTALDLQALTLDGNLNVTASSITQAGPLIVGGTSAFTAAAGQSVVLNSAGNSFAGAVTLAAGGAGSLQNVTLRDSTALDLQALTIDGNLNVTSGAAISQSGSLSVAGAASFRTLNDAGAAITLDGTNSFGSVQAAVRNAADTLNAAANVVIQENDDTVLGDVQTGSGQSVSITSAGAIAALANTDVSAGSVSLVAAGDIGSAATRIALVAPNGSINAVSSGNVYLANTSGIGSTVALDQIVAGNTGIIDLVSDGDIRVADVRAGNSVSLTSTNGGILDDGIDGAGSQLVTDNLTLQAAGSIGQASGVGNGTLDLQAGSLSATAQGGGVYLDETDGDINIRQVSAAGPVWLQAGGGSIVDDPADAAAASITSSSGGVQLGALNNIGTATDVRTRQGTPIAINTNGGALSARVTSATGQINLAIASGSNPTAAAAAISAGGAGRLLLQSAGDLSLDSFSSAISGFTEAGFSSDATLSLREQQSELITGPLATLLLHGGNDIVQTDRVFDLSATHLVFESGAQGGGVALNTNVDVLDAAVGNGASLTVVEGLGDITLGTISAGGDVSIRAANIFDDGDLNGITRVAAGNALSLVASAGIGREEGASGGRIDTSGNSVSVLTDAGPVFISHLGNLQLSGGLTVSSVNAAGLVNLATSGALIQAGGIASAGNAISLFADSIDMQASATTISQGGDITYVANGGDVTLAVLDAAGGRALVIAAGNVYSALGSTSATNNLTASAVEVRAGGLGGGAGEIGTVSSPLAIATPVGAGRSVYLIVPTRNGIQTSTPRINYAGPSSSLLLKGYSGSSGALLFDQASTFTPDTVLRNGESIVPLLNGRIAVNSDSLGAAKQALSSGVVSRVNVDWAAFDPNVSLFGTLDPALRLPADQIDEAGPAANLIPQGTTLVVTRDGWKLVPAFQQISMVR